MQFSGNFAKILSWHHPGNPESATLVILGELISNQSDEINALKVRNIQHLKFSKIRLSVMHQVINVKIHEHAESNRLQEAECNEEVNRHDYILPILMKHIFENPG